MSDIHIDDFYRDIALTLIQLYKNFPRKITVFVEDISGPDSPDDFGLHSERHIACFSALCWLAESGYIDYQETIRQEALDQCTLTHKGFTLLSTPAFPKETVTDSELPATVLAVRSTNIAKLRAAIKDGHSQRLNALMQDLLMQSHQH